MKKDLTLKVDANLPEEQLIMGIDISKGLESALDGAFKHDL